MEYVQMERKPFFNGEPQDLIRVLEMMQTLMNGTQTREEIETIAPLCGGDGTFQQALDIAQSEAKINALWVREARVKWLKLGLIAWEKYVGPATPVQDLKHALFSFPGFDQVQPGGMTYGTLQCYITPRYVGHDCNGLLDRLLDILQVVRDLTDNPFFPNLMKGLISRRTGCERGLDPHRDELVYHLLMTRYGLVP